MQTKNIPYTFKRNGYYYFSRRVPIDLQDHYIYPRIVRGLNTKDYSTAKVLARVSSVELEKFWIKLRLSNPNLLGSNLLKLQSNKSEQNPYISLDKGLRLLEEIRDRLDVSETPSPKQDGNERTMPSFSATKD